MIDAQERTLAAAIGFVQGHATIDGEALAATLARVPVGADGAPGRLRDPMQHRQFDAGLCQAGAPGGGCLRPQPHQVSLHLKDIVF